jgi:hypothetical protein
MRCSGIGPPTVAATAAARARRARRGCAVPDPNPALTRNGSTNALVATDPPRADAANSSQCQYTRCDTRSFSLGIQVGANANGPACPDR